MTDNEIFLQYRQSREPALLEELVRRNFDRIYRFVASMLGKQRDGKRKAVGKWDVVDDLVQDVLLNIVRGIDRFRGESAFSTWIWRIATNRVYRYFEETKKFVPTLETEQLETMTDSARGRFCLDSASVSGRFCLDFAGNHNVAIANEWNQRITAAIAELSPALRAALLLTTVEGLSPDQAAEVEGCTAANIHWRVHKARKILKEKLKDYSPTN